MVLDCRARGPNSQPALRTPLVYRLAVIRQVRCANVWDSRLAAKRRRVQFSVGIKCAMHSAAPRG